MKYYSTENNSPKVTFREALLKGLAPDRGLYMPESLKKYSNNIFNKQNFQEISFEAAKLLVDGEIPDHIRVKG